jgi:peroxiredoxin
MTLGTKTLGRCLSLLALAGLWIAAPSFVTADEPTPTFQEELEALQERYRTAAPADRLKVFEEGIEKVAKSGVLESALKVGAKAPNFKLPDQDGDPVELSKLLEDGPVVVTWYRGGWCAFCNIALRGLSRKLPEIREQGASVVAISPEAPKHATETVESNELGFPALFDQGNKVAQQYGLAYRMPDSVIEQFRDYRNLPDVNGDDSWRLPLAATYIIDSEGVIRYAFVEADYRKRADPAQIVAALRELRSANESSSR